MSKTIRLAEDVYLALKARSAEQGKTLSETVYALLSGDEKEDRLVAVENKIDELKSLLFSEECPNHPLNKKIKGRERNSNPRHGLHGAILDIPV
jgi:predicted CopG family antitoxin